MEPSTDRNETVSHETGEPVVRPGPDPIPGTRPRSAPALPDQAILLVTGLLLAVISQLLHAQSYGPALNFSSLVVLILAAIVFLAGIQENPLNKTNPLRTALAWMQRKSGLSLVQVMFLLLSLGSAVLAVASAGQGGKMSQPALTVGAWLAAITFAFLCGLQPSGKRKPFPWQALAWALGLALVALPIRAIDTAHVPLALSGDEASFGLGAVGFLRGNWNNIFGINWFSFPSLFLLIPAAFIQVLGQTAPALRIPAALAGSATVAGVYLLGRTLFNHRTGLFGALLLAGLHFHIHFSRLGLNNIWDGLFFVFVSIAFWRAWHNHRRMDFLLTGFLMGLSQYFYVTNRLLPLLVAVWAFLFWLNDRPSFRRNLPGLGLMFFMACVVYAPLGWLYLKNPTDYLAPFSRVSISRSIPASESSSLFSLLLVLALQILDGFRGYTDLATRAWYLSGVPVLRPLMAALFLLGWIPLVLRLRDGRTWMLLSWVAAIAVVGGLSESTPAAQRYVAGAPVAALVAGYCLSEVVGRLEIPWPKRRWWFMGAGLAIVAIAMTSDMAFYFGEYTPQSAKHDINTRIAQRLADYLQQKQGGWEVVFYGEPYMGYYSISSLSYLAPKVKGLDAHLPWGDPANPVPTAENVIFVFIREHEEDMQKAQQTYPGGKLIQQTDPQLGFLDWIYELSPFPQNP